MGYTHYWKFKNDVAPKDIEGGKEKFAKASAIITKALSKVRGMNIEICNGVGEGLPKISDKLIYFNGSKAKDEDCETFCIDINDGSWDFCKTCHKPYNLLVCLALLAFKWAFGEDFTYTTDGITKEAYENRESNAYWKQIGFAPEGPSEDWAAAYKVWEEVSKELGL